MNMIQKIILVFIGCFISCMGLSACTKKNNVQKGSDRVLVEMETSMGKIVLELDHKAAPVTVDNFTEYAMAGFYDGTIFHRVIDGFMIQGGGFDSSMTQKAVRAPIKNEASNGLGNEPMTVAMARTNDPNSATAQFFINLVNNKNLNHNNFNPGYAVFGKVIEGEDVVRKIAKVATTSKGMYENVPAQPVIIQKVAIR